MSVYMFVCVFVFVHGVCGEEGEQWGWRGHVKLVKLLSLLFGLVSGSMTDRWNI